MGFWGKIFGRETPPSLHEAVREYDFELVKSLLDKGVEVEVKNGNDRTPLISASENGYLDIVKALIDKKADVNAKDKKGMTALMIASWKGHKDILNTLLAKGAGVNDKDNSSGETALYKASKMGHGDIVNTLLAKGADVNAKDKNGMTALIIASEKGYKDIFETLLVKGASVNEENNTGCTALFRASLSGHGDIVNTLLAKGAEVNTKNKNGITALYKASEKGHGDIVNTLLAKGADVNAKDNNDRTALMITSKKGHKDIFETLLAKGASVNDKDNSGITALYEASGKGHGDIVNTLLAKGADVNTKSKTGMTSLFSASMGGHNDIVNMLLDKGADVNERDNGGNTALLYPSTEFKRLLWKEIAYRKSLLGMGDGPVFSLVDRSQLNNYQETVITLGNKGADEIVVLNDKVRLSLSDFSNEAAQLIKNSCEVDDTASIGTARNDNSDKTTESFVNADKIDKDTLRRYIRSTCLINDLTYVYLDPVIKLGKGEFPDDEKLWDKTASVIVPNKKITKFVEYGGADYRWWILTSEDSHLFEKDLLYIVLDFDLPRKDRAMTFCLVYDNDANWLRYLIKSNSLVILSGPNKSISNAVSISIDDNFRSRVNLWLSQFG